MVPTRTPSGVTSVEERRVSLTSSGEHSMSAASGRSVRRKTIPVSGGAGRSVSRIRSPECNPTPLAVTGALRVR